jgi:hypothetical protein
MLASSLFFREEYFNHDFLQRDLLAAASPLSPRASIELDRSAATQISELQHKLKDYYEKYQKAAMRISTLEKELDESRQREMSIRNRFDEERRAWEIRVHEAEKTISEVRLWRDITDRRYLRLTSSIVCWFFCSFVIDCTSLRWTCRCQALWRKLILQQRHSKWKFLDLESKQSDCTVPPGTSTVPKDSVTLVAPSLDPIRTHPRWFLLIWHHRWRCAHRECFSQRPRRNGR